MGTRYAREGTIIVSDTDTDTTPSEVAERAEQLDLAAGGIIMHNGLPVGTYADCTITLNLGWCRLAGLGVIIEDDPAVDRHRTGRALDRPASRR